MAQQNIDFGTFPDDPSADAIRTAFQKVQTNFDQLFGTNANSTVNSINRTPGAGITVNYPTGNVVISANIAWLLVATTSLKVGKGADNTLSNVTITSSSQQLNIDIDPAQVLSHTFGAPAGALANLNGTLTSNSFYQPYINTLGTLANLAVTGNSTFNGNANFTGANINFSNISNLHIPGGSPGYFLQTQDGTGTLAWSAGGGGGNGSPGGVNSQVQFNDTGTFGGNTGFTFNKTTGVLTTPSITVTNNAIIGNILGALANGNSNVNIPVVDGNVNISAAGNANIFVVTGVGANLAGNLTVGNADLGNLATVNYITGVLTTNAQPNITSTGTLSNLTITGNVSAGNADLGNLTTSNYFAGVLITNAQPNITSTGELISVSVTGNANIGNLNVANNAIITGNLSVLGNATYINIESLVIEDPIISLGGGPNGDPLVANDGKDRGTALQYYVGSPGVGNPVTAFMGWDNSNSEFAFGSNVSITSEVVTFANLGNVRASYFISANTEFGNANLGNTAIANYFVGRFYGNANAATVANTVVDNAQPNITSVGTLISLSVSGNTTVGNLIGRVANGNSGITITADANINFTAVGNATPQLIITGTGANVNGKFNVSGNLTSANILGPLSNGNSNVNIPSANGNINLTAVGNTTLVVTDTGANITGTANVSGNANVSNLGTGGLITATGNITGGNLVTAGVVSATGNITSASGVFIGNGAGLTNINAGNITGAYGNSQVATFLNAYGSNTITTTGNVSVGNIIGNGQALTGLVGGNVTGAVAYATTANAVAGANVSGQVGNALVAGTVYTAAQGNITSVGTLTSLSVSGNITSGNISATNHTGTTANLTGQYITTIATGTAPFVVTSTTQVANLNVENAGLATFATTANAVAGANVSGQVGNALVAGTVYTAAQGNITSTGTLTSVSVSGNANIGNIGTGGLITATGNLNAGNIITGGIVSATGNGTFGNVSATTFTGALSGAATSATTAGTVTTNAQGNITSVGTLTSVSVSGNANVGNLGTAGLITATGNINGGNIITAGIVSATGNGTFGNVSATTFTGALSGAATTAGSVTTNAQGNITSVGTLTSVSVSGNANVGNLGTGGFITASGNISGSNVIASSYHIRSVSASVSAAGSVQGNATALTTEFNRVSTVSSGQGVVLPTAVAGMAITIVNTSANALVVYPAASAQINALAANVGYTHTTLATLQYIAISGTQWYTVGATYA